MEHNNFFDFEEFKTGQEKFSEVGQVYNELETKSLNIDNIQEAIKITNEFIYDLKQKIKNLKEKDRKFIDDSKDVIDIYNLMILKQKLQENLRKIHNMFSEKKEDLSYIQKKIAISQNFPNIISIEKSKLSILRLELTHLIREENSYKEKIMNIDTEIALNYRKNNLGKNKGLKIKQELVLLRENLLRKEETIKALEYEKVNFNMKM
ncbi:MAG: hypothetical protein ACTSPS_13300 [Promethearchaeota archaeon]